ncbi:hypothetical protein ACH5RR_004289 [Cinchona calisaya]|uniref:Receptor-like serine/threonine-protein kinase n=1 Tax=Cinchona calisaya TaxID=153742 RepID=A0ABD3AXI1_9GENT
MMRLRRCCAIITIFILHLHNNVSEAQQNTLKPSDALIGSYNYLESTNKYFRFKFIQRPWSPQSWYLGIDCVFNDPPITVWVVFPNASGSYTSPRLFMSTDGQLQLFSYSQSLVVNADQPEMVENTTATLLDNGNLVLTAPDDGRILWQSFDYPSNTWLPGMKLGLFGSKNHLLASWMSKDNPSPGAFTFSINTDGSKNSVGGELVAMRRGVPYWRSGEWNGNNFSFLDRLNLPGIFDVLISYYFSNKSERYFTWNFTNDQYTITRLQSNGEIDLIPYTSYIVGTSGYAVACDVNEGEELDMYRNDAGCIINPKHSSCGGRYKFNKTIGDIDKWDILSNSSLGLGDCRDICRRTCSCDAFASQYSDGTGYKFAISGKYRFSYTDKGDTIYLRLEKAPRTLSFKWKLVIGLLLSLLMASILICLFCGCQKRIRRMRGTKKLGQSEEGDDDLPFFSLSSIRTATNDFSDENKLGQGGFGPVYKGELFNGQKIAVKRLSRLSGHGIQQFKNEVILISKLQHRNLVRLLGYCNEGEERLLVYEYLPNKSLDSILFDASKQALLDWKTRVNIIGGIAQGLLYLHKYSRLKIIHRDMKTSNILLDDEMNPKISDFGTARIFQDNDSRANTKTIVGTYGYMSPEYAMDGLFSEKSDVFSFGVMVLEIISGKKNTSFYHPDRDLNLLGYAWDLWKEGRVSDFADSTIAETFSISSGLRYVHIGLLCVQENAADRPTMLNVVSMLLNESTALLPPKQPAFSAIVSLHSDDYSGNPQPASIDDATFSDVQGR